MKKKKTISAVTVGGKTDADVFFSVQRCESDFYHFGVPSHSLEELQLTGYETLAHPIRKCNSKHHTKVKPCSCSAE